MNHYALSDAFRRASRYLDDHPVLRWFVAPLLFMGGIVLVLGVALDAVTMRGAVELTVTYLAVSAVAIVLGVLVERIIVAIVDR